MGSFGATDIRRREPVTRGKGSNNHQGGKPSKTRKYELIGSGWGEKGDSRGAVRLPLNTLREEPGELMGSQGEEEEPRVTVSQVEPAPTLPATYSSSQDEQRKETECSTAEQKCRDEPLHTYNGMNFDECEKLPDDECGTAMKKYEMCTGMQMKVARDENVDFVEEQVCKNVQVPAPSMMKNVKQVKKQVTQFRMRDDKWCRTHECEASVRKSNRKEWAWLSKKKQYGWKYMTVRNVICEGMNVAYEKSQKFADSDSMAKGGNLSDTRVGDYDSGDMTNLKSESSE